MDVVETAVGHDDHEIAVARLRDDGVDDGAVAVDVPRVLPARDEVAHEIGHRQAYGSSGRFVRNTEASTTSSASANASANACWKTRRQLDADRGSKIAQMRAARVRAPHAAQRLGDRRRMVREVVVDATRRARDDHAVPCVASRRQTSRARRRSAANGTSRDAATAIAASALRTLCRPVIGSVDSRRWPLPAWTHRRTPSRPGPARCRAPASGAVVDNPNVSTRPNAGGASDAAPASSAPRKTRPLVGTRRSSRVNAVRIARDVGIDVGVVELDVVDHDRLGHVLEELRRLVEEGAVVLVALDDEVAAAAEPVARPEVGGDAADQQRRVEPRMRQYPRHQARGGRLAMRARRRRSGVASQRNSSRMRSGSEQ